MLEDLDLNMSFPNSPVQAVIFLFPDKVDRELSGQNKKKEQVRESEAKLLWAAKPCELLRQEIRISGFSFFFVALKVNGRSSLTAEETGSE